MESKSYSGNISLSFGGTDQRAVVRHFNKLEKSNIKTMINYKTSRDYKRLKELLDAGNEVVCFTTYDFNWVRRNESDYMPLMTTDICRAKFLKGSVSEQEDRYHFGVRGCVFFEYWKNLDKWTFEEACEEAQIEFIEPTDSNIVLTK